MTTHLILTYYWFDEILSGRKKVEYRRNCSHWRKRLLNGSLDYVVLHRGYTPTTMTWKVKKVKLGQMGIEIHLDYIDYRA